MLPLTLLWHATRYSTSVPTAQTIAGFNFSKPFDFGCTLRTVGYSAEIAMFVKWAILNAYQIDGKLHDNYDGTFTVLVEAAHESMKGLNFVAATLHKAFRDLLAAFLALPGSSARFSRIFIRAVYDGLLGDEKRDGELLPPPVTVKIPKGRRRSLAIAPALSIHPYSIGVEMGRKIRLNLPIDQIAGDLADAEQLARLN